ncbi:MAG: tRNA (adenosine(37)-N6)-dimethylallyltransferase MiaA [Saprospiraceae bacterium]|nr:tRNA (adenosine(37)-N6)-dimethylallyltransferase MiaA [Saprospiraceae bacterium]
MKYLIVVAGPTASGKTGLGIKLAQHFNTSILSADSRQFYREMSVGTAKPTEEELAQAEHLFINNLSIHDEYSVGDYEREAIEALNNIYKEKDVAVMVGGSGLFIQAVCDGLNEFPEVSKEIREDLTKSYEKHGLWVLQKELKEVDPEYYDFVDTNNSQRLIRALEIYRASGQPYSSFRDQDRKEREFTPIYIVLDWDRDELYDKINLRVDVMMKDGLLKEIESLYDHKDLNALQTVGYKEFFAFKEGEYDVYEAIRLVKRNSRRYAKRQMTWFRKIEEAGFFHPTEMEDILKFINIEMGLEEPEDEDEIGDEEEMEDDFDGIDEDMDDEIEDDEDEDSDED